MLSCKEATKLASAAMDRKLGFRELAGLRVHLLYCKWCRRFDKQLGLISQMAKHRD